MSDDARTRIGFDLDKISVENVKRAYKTVRDEINDTGKTAKDVAAGLGGLGGGTSKLRSGLDALKSGNLLEAVSGIGDLAESLPEVASGAKEAVGALSGGGGGLIGNIVKLGAVGGVAGVALVGLGLAMKSFFDQANKQAEELGGAIDAQREVNNSIAQGLTTEDAQKQIAELQRLRSGEAEIRDDLQAGWKDMNDTLLGLGDVVGIVEPRTKKLKEELSESEGIIEGYDAKIAALKESMKDGSLSANDAAAAQEALANTQGEAAQAADKSAKEQADSAAKAVKAAEESAQKIDDARRRYKEAMSDIATETNRASADARKSNKRAIRDLASETKSAAASTVRAANDARLEALADFHSDEQRARRENERALADITKQATRTQQDLLADRNFLAIDQLSKQTKRQVEDEAEAAAAAKEEREIAARERLAELKRGLSIELRERKIGARERKRQLGQSLRDELQDIRTASRRRLSDARTAQEREIAIARDGMQTKLQMEAEYWTQSTGLVRQSLAAGEGLAGPNVTNNVGSTINTNLQINGSGLSSEELQLAGLNIMRQVGLVGN